MVVLQVLCQRYVDELKLILSSYLAVALPRG